MNRWFMTCPNNIPNIFVSKCIYSLEKTIRILELHYTITLTTNRRGKYVYSTRFSQSETNTSGVQLPPCYCKICNNPNFQLIFNQNLLIHISSPELINLKTLHLNLLKEIESETISNQILSQNYRDLPITLKCAD